VLQGHHSPDLALCNFFSFGCLKLQLEGKRFFDENDVKKELGQILTEMPVDPLHSVMGEWTHRPKQCIELAGDRVS
jgi:hypothetical protein